MSKLEVPDGFAVHDRSSPMTDPWQPIYSRVTESALNLGLLIREAHCNGRGFLHGGLITTLADNAMGLSVYEVLRERGREMPAGAMTLSLSVDFIRRGNVGDWVEFRPTVHKAGKTISLVSCDVVANDSDLIARGNATFMAAS